jgi:hypothetical protein
VVLTESYFPGSCDLSILEYSSMAEVNAIDLTSKNLQNSIMRDDRCPRNYLYLLY